MLQICSTKCEEKIIPSSVTEVRDEQNDQINGQLETLLGLLQQWNVTCIAEEDSENISVFDACEALQDEVQSLTEDIRDYVSNQYSVLITK